MFEKVNPCHPDKVADRIAGAIVDLCYTKSHDPKVACEVLIGHGVDFYRKKCERFEQRVEEKDHGLQTVQ